MQNERRLTWDFLLLLSLQDQKNGQEATRGGEFTAEQTDGCDSSPCPVRADAGVDPQRA